MLPAARAANGPVYVFPSDRKYGLLAVGGQGSGKTSLLLRLYLSDIRDPDTAVIVVDPKSELAKLCLEMTPPGGKRVWYLDLGAPMFGMSPLRTNPARSLGEQASAIADNFVQAISETAEGQVFQSSRRYLYHSVIGALALAQKRGGLASLEDVFGLLLPVNAELREAAVNACQEHADLDHTTEFFRVTLPDELDANRSNTYQRLDPPRNKLEAILASPSLHRFYSHRTDVQLSDIIAARDILIIDANMAAIGPGNSLVCMHLFQQQLDAAMQAQIQIPAAERGFVAEYVEEAHALMNKMTMIKQAAVHREAGLEVTMGTQYLSQLGAQAESAAVTEAIRKGVTNLLQSHALFRQSDPEDAERQSRVAMPVYQSTIRGDLEARELMGAPPEKSIYLPNYFFLASWIVNGARASPFYAETCAFEKISGGAWARHHMRLLAEAVGSYQQTPSTYKPNEPAQRTETKRTSRAASSKPSRSRKARRDSSPPAAGVAAGSEPPKGTSSHTDTGAAANTGADGAAREAGQADDAARQPAVRPLIRQAEQTPDFSQSPTLRVLGATPESDAPRLFRTGTGEMGLRELAAWVDPLLGIKDREQEDPGERLPRLYREDYAILALLDRVGMALPGMIRRAVMPNVADRTMRDRINGKLFRQGLVERWPIVLRDASRGSLPYLYTLTRHGMQVAQERQPPAIPPSREYRALEVEKDSRIRHDLHMLSWVIEFHRILGDYATDKWRTPRWPAGTCAVPQTGHGRGRRPITLKDIEHPKHIGLFNLDSANIARIEPDVTCEIRLPEQQLTIDLMIELDLTDRAAYNHAKFARYDTFLTGWWSQTRRYQQIATRPGVLFLCSTPQIALSYATAADQIMRGSIGATGSPTHERYYPGRQHIFFAHETAIYRGDLTVLALPALPPDVRQALDGSSAPALSRVQLFPEKLLAGEG